MNELKVLEVEFESNGIKNAIYPVILSDEKDMILIDCGYPNFLPLIEESAIKNGINLNKLTKLIITHHDFDHMGSAADFKRKYPNLNIISSAMDEKYISGKEKSLRLQQAELIYDKLPEQEKENARNFQRKLESVEPVKVNMVVNDGDTFDWCGGLEIVGTPGHMPGHISIYAKESKTLIAGDALVVEGENLAIANPNYTLDMDTSKESIRKLLNYDIEKIVCYHGGVHTREIKTLIERILL
jgi:glyoxylase-like metal-dependent hydrolase (beta-lactamase superfamily II)